MIAKEKMCESVKTAVARVSLALSMGAVEVTLSSTVSATNPGNHEPAVLNKGEIKKVQETLRDKGYYSGPIDGSLGTRTRAAIRQYQQSEKMPVTGRLDRATAGKLGVGLESPTGSFEGAAKNVN